MALTIPIAHDFVCPWCWIGLKQARRLQAEYGVQIDWRAYELWPAELPRPAASVVTPPPTNRPVTPTRIEFLEHVEGIRVPQIERPKGLNTHRAHLSVEFAKTLGLADAWIDRLYQAFWEEGQNIDDLPTLERLAFGVLPDATAMIEAVRAGRGAENIVKFDDDAYANGVYNVPTFFIGDNRFAEQPYTVLAAAVETEIGPKKFYHQLTFPAPPADRPYVFLNMVSTIDGKILTGGRDESVHDLGSDEDHAAMGRIEAHADAVLTGAHSIRATTPKWNPSTEFRFTATQSGNLPWDAGYLTNGRPVIFSPAPLNVSADPRVEFWPFTDWASALRQMREHGVERLLLLGGSELNAQLFAENLIDEVFLTFAPKIKLGRDIPTIADGEALPRELVQQYELVEHHVVGSELFLRYRRRR